MTGCTKIHLTAVCRVAGGESVGRSNDFPNLYASWQKLADFVPIIPSLSHLEEYLNHEPCTLDQYPSLSSMSFLAEHVLGISAAYEAKRSEVTALRKLFSRFASHPLFLVSKSHTLTLVSQLIILSAKANFLDPPFGSKRSGDHFSIFLNVYHYPRRRVTILWTISAMRSFPCWGPRPKNSEPKDWSHVPSFQTTTHRLNSSGPLKQMGKCPFVSLWSRWIVLMGRRAPLKTGWLLFITCVLGTVPRRGPLNGQISVERRSYSITQDVVTKPTILPSFSSVGPLSLESCDA